MYRIFVVEDDAVIAGMLCRELNAWGFETRAAQNFSDVMGEFRAFAPHLVLMDVSLPFHNGYFRCAEIRRESRVPVIFVSSRSDDMDVIMAVNMGGDDYITKPVSTDVLVAKVQAMLRRSYDYETPPPQPRLRGAVLDAAASCLMRGGERIPLTKNELGILLALLEKPGQVVSRESIMLRLWESDEFVDDNTLTVNVNRLRKTLAAAGMEDCIVAHKGQGYSIDA